MQKYDLLKKLKQKEENIMKKFFQQIQILLI